MSWRSGPSPWFVVWIYAFTSPVSRKFGCAPADLGHLPFGKTYSTFRCGSISIEHARCSISVHAWPLPSSHTQTPFLYAAIGHALSSHH